MLREGTCPEITTRVGKSVGPVVVFSVGLPQPFSWAGRAADSAAKQLTIEGAWGSRPKPGSAAPEAGLDGALLY